MKINWLQKLSSRKFWAAVVGVALLIAILVGGDALSTAQSELIEKILYLLIAYIFGESAVDIAKAVKGADTDNNGTIDFEELVDAVANTIVDKEKNNEAN